VRTIDSFVPQPGTPAGLRVRHRDRALELVLPGSVLETQLELHDGGYLLLTTAGRPYEETLTIVLLDPAGRELERLALEQPYTPGVLSHVEILGDSILRFRFFPGSIHELRIHVGPRGLFRRRRLQLQTSPAPACP
jgi:hypothetical protein